MRAPVPWRWIGAFVVLKLAVTLAFADRYGWHRDELYYLASSRHLDFGYVDYPPLVPVLAAADQLVGHGSLVALRALPAAAGAAIIVLTALIARELGGSIRAQAWAAFAALLSPMFLGGNLMFQTVAFDELAWAAALFVFARLLRDSDQRLWLLVGLVIGIGLETKFTIAALPVAILLAVFVASRQMLASPWPWAGAAVSLAIFAPNLVWQAGHSWISVQYTLSHRGHTDGPIAYWLEQLLLFNPIFVVPAIAGIAALRNDSRFEPMLYTAIFVELIFFASGGKAYYPAAIYPALYAAGALWLDARLKTRRPSVTFAIANVALILVLLPIGLPVLDAQTMVKLNLWQSRKDYADMIGWPELAQQTAAAYASLTPDQRDGAIILAQNYGEAGAIDYYGPDLGLPRAISPHLSYWYWAPADLNPSTAVLVGWDEQEADKLFADCRVTGTITNSLGIHNEEYGNTVMVCTGPREPLWKVWGELQLLD